MPKLKRPGGDKQPVWGQFQCLGTGKDYRPSCLHRVGSQLHFNRIFLSTGQNHAGQPCACQLLHGASPKAARALPCFLSERCWLAEAEHHDGKMLGLFLLLSKHCRQMHDQLLPRAQQGHSQSLGYWKSAFRKSSVLSSAPRLAWGLYLCLRAPSSCSREPRARCGAGGRSPGCAPVAGDAKWSRRLLAKQRDRQTDRCFYTSKETGPWEAFRNTHRSIGSF